MDHEKKTREKKRMSEHEDTLTRWKTLCLNMVMSFQPIPVKRRKDKPLETRKMGTYLPVDRARLECDNQ